VLQEDGQCKVERTGLHEYEFIETRRYTFHEKAEVTLNDSAAVLNLVEGREAWIKSSDDRWEPKKIHYGETFIVPADVKEFVIKACEGEMVQVIVATMR
jgi:mannose-6-phosphate isomerase class I